MNLPPRFIRQLTIAVFIICFSVAGAPRASAAGFGDYVVTPFESLVTTFETVFGQLIALAQLHHTVTVSINPTSAALWHDSGRSTTAAAFNSMVAAAQPQTSAASPIRVLADAAPSGSVSFAPTTASDPSSVLTVPAPSPAPQQQSASYITQDELTAQLQAATNNLRSLIYQSVSAPNSTFATGGFTNEIAASNKIDQLTGTTLSNVTVSGVSGLAASDIPTNIVAANYLPLSGGALTGNFSVGSTITGNVSLGSISSTVVNDGKYNAFPGLALLPNGHLIVVYRKGTTHTSTDGVLYSRTSADQGQTWSAEATVYSSGSVDARDPEIVLLSSGKLLLSFFTTNATSSVTNVHTMLGTPTGDAVSWGSDNIVNTGFTKDQAESSKAIQLANGNILLPIYGDNTGDTNDSAAVVTSTDGGNTWSTENTTASATGQEYDEANGVQLSSGRIVLIIRHDVGTDGYARVYSDDNGATWSSPVNVISQPSFQGRPTVLLINGGGLLLLTRGSGDTAVYAVSWDQGVTWTNFAGYGPSSQPYMYGSAVLQSDGTISAVIASQTSGTDSYITYQQFLPPSTPSSGGITP